MSTRRDNFVDESIRVEMRLKLTKLKSDVQKEDLTSSRGIWTASSSHHRHLRSAVGRSAPRSYSVDYCYLRPPADK